MLTLASLGGLGLRLARGERTLGPSLWGGSLFSEPSASPYYNVSEDEINTGQYNLNILKDALALGPVSMDVSVTDGGNLTATFSLTVNPTA